jgi:CRP/FNR family cyclic AMP-dependent transcriptional regulator
MTIRTVESLARESDVFRGLGDDWIDLVAGCARTAQFDDGDYLFHAGTDADTFYLVRRGTVVLEVFAPNRGSFTIETLDEGEVVGWSWLFPPYRWHFSARADGLVRALAFDGACLRGKCQEDPALGYELTSRFAGVMLERLEATQLRLLDVYGDGH